jgi:hypothetical protein
MGGATHGEKTAGVTLPSSGGGPDVRMGVRADQPRHSFNAAWASASFGERSSVKISTARLA